ncbi:MAG: hypothetical protein AAGI15_08465 [Pseudomonadota bacterium]
MKANAVLLITTALLSPLTWADSYWNAEKPVRESVEVAQHYQFASDVAVDGATILVRDYRNRVIDVTVTTKALVPDTAYSIWIAAFNRPWACATPYACGLGDLGNERVKASVFWGGGLISDAFGYGGTQLKLAPGQTERELFTGGDYGLANMRAEVHVVLRSHGPTGVAGPVAEQLGTANAACPPAGCSNDFASIHSIR